jgi:hypothetical protein
MKITDMLAGALGSLIAFLPNLLAALIILGIGLFLAAVLGNVTTRLLTALGLERRRRVRQFVGHEATFHRLPHTGGRIVYWLVAFVTAGLAIDALKLTWLSAGVAAVLSYLPSMLAAAAIVAVGYFLGNFAYRKLSERVDLSLMWAKLARAATLVLAGFMAVQQLGIASAIVTTAFTLLLGAMAVAAAVAFGFGNRELAGRITEEWYERRGRGRRLHRPDLEDRFFPQH